MDRMNKKRMSLKQVQPSASHPNIVAGNNLPVRSEIVQKKRSLGSSSASYKKQKIGSHSGGSFKVYEDQPDVETEKTVKRGQITADDLTSEETTIDYWKILAETRREALDNTLLENKQLHVRVTELENQVTELKSDLEKAEELAEHAEYLADTIKKLTEDVEHDSELSPRDSTGDNNSRSISESVGVNDSENDSDSTRENNSEDSVINENDVHKH